MKNTLRLMVLAGTLAALIAGCGREGPLPPPDSTPPEVSFTKPGDGAEEVPINSGIIVTFSESMDSSTINDQTIILTLGGSAVTGAITFTGTTAVFTPDAILSPLSRYVLTITVGVKDVSGNAMAKSYVCIFDTGELPDTTAPEVLTNEPEGNEVSIYSRMSVTFNEPMDPSTVTIDTFAVSSVDGTLAGDVTVDNTGAKAIFMPSAPLAYDTAYTVTIVGGESGVKDMAGNALFEDYIWSFSTELPPPDPTQLKVTKTGTGAGTVIAYPGELMWYDNTGIATYNEGVMVTLTAIANEGSTFTGWSGCDSIIDETVCGVDMAVSKNVTATFTINTYTIQATADPSGGISPSGAVTVTHGASQTFTISPSMGYHVADVLVDGASVGEVTSYAFTNVAADHTINASFAINTYTIEATAGTGGSISPSGFVSVNHGAAQSFTITPAVGYSIADVLADSVFVGDLPSYTFTNVTSDHTIAATFLLNTYIVATSVVGSGTIAPTSQAVSHGSTASFTVTPATGYHIESVTGCGGTLSVDTYTTGPITADCTVSVTFTLNTYTLTVTKDGTGTGTVTSSPVGIDCGLDCSEPYDHDTTVVLTAAAEADSTFVGWSGEGCSGTSDCTVRMTGVTGVTASFDPVP